MKTLMIVAVVVAVTWLEPTPLSAHTGHAHKAMGTITSVEGNHLMVKTTDGKTVMVMLDAKTKVTRGKTTLEAGALRVGDRIVAEGPEEKTMIMATTVKLGDVPATTAKK